MNSTSSPSFSLPQREQWLILVCILLDLLMHIPTNVYINIHHTIHVKSFFLGKLDSIKYIILQFVFL